MGQGLLHHTRKRFERTLMLSLSEILNNQKEVVFSFGEDTISITYKPYAFDKADWKQFFNLAKRVDMQRPDKFIDRIVWSVRKYPRMKLFKRYLKKTIVDWDLTDGKEKLSIDEGLNSLPAYFIEQLYKELMAEVTISTRRTLNTELKKK